MIGAYACPRGVFAVACRQRRAGLEVFRTFEVHTRIESPNEATAHLNRALAEAGIRRAEIALAVRGFGMSHHALTFPPAPDAVLQQLVDREIRRLEPDMEDPVAAWVRLAPGDFGETDQPQASLLVAAASRDVCVAFTRGVHAAGHALVHLTALPVAMHRLSEEFIDDADATALVAHLPDGPYLGFALAGAIRLVVEPPVSAEDPLPEATIVAEEAELGVVFVRQQFRGAQVARAAVIASDEAYPELESAITERLGLPVSRVAVPRVSAGAMAAFGAILDARAATPVALAGRGVRRTGQPHAALQVVAVASVALVALAGLWAITGALQARAASSDLELARRRIDQESSGIAPVRETAARRRLARDAVAAIRLVAGDRDALLRGLASVAGAVSGPVTVDSILIVRSAEGWRAEIGGKVRGETSGRAVQALSEFYRDLPRRALVDSLALGQLFYADSAGASFVHFQISFGLRGTKSD